MKQVMVLKDTKALKALLNKWRSKILQLLTFQEYTVQQLAKVLEINPGTAYHHVKVLQEAGLVEETRTEMEKNIVMRYYRAVAKEFRVDFGTITGRKMNDKEITQWVKSRVKGLIDGLKAYDIEIPEKSQSEAEELISKLVNLENKIKEEITPKKPEILDRIGPSAAKDVFSLIALYNLSQNKEYTELRGNLVNFLKKHESR
ncbi:MAG: ArsR/SmtB family transcription factor [Candidatus Wukongarchaeota archaeon]|nr:helix-turn-helix domain-containing protein [Candidatus Wukongarchaeota archaeon]